MRRGDPTFNFLYVRREAVGYIGYDPDNAYVVLLSDDVEPVLSQLGEKVRDNRKYGRPFGAPLSIEYYPSFFCNLSCPYCYVRSPSFLDTLRRSGFEVDVSCQPEKDFNVSVSKVERALVDYVDARGIYQVHILGGEPFLYDGLKNFVMLVLQNTRSIVDITTNGTVPIPRWFVRLKRKYESRIILNISLQGISGDVFSRLSGLPESEAARTQKSFYENLKMLNSEQIPVSISSLIVKSTVEELEQHAALVKSYPNIVSWVWKYPLYYDNAWFRDEVIPLSDFFRLFQQYSKALQIPMAVDAPFAYRAFEQAVRNALDRMLVPCPAGIRRAAVLPNGAVYGCLLLPDSYMGNVLDGNIHIPPRKYVAMGCSDCTFSGLCTGCPAFARINGLDYDNRCPYRPAAPNLLEYSDDVLLGGGLNVDE